MKQPIPLQRKLLIALVAVSFAAIVLCIACFSWMLHKAADEALAKNLETNSMFVDVTGAGFFQTSVFTQTIAMNHAYLVTKDMSFLDDKEHLYTCISEFNAVYRDDVKRQQSSLKERTNIPDGIFFTSRDGEITAAVRIKDSLVSDIPADEAYKTLSGHNMENDIYNKNVTLRDILADSSPQNLYNLDSLETAYSFVKLHDEDTGIGYLIEEPQAFYVFEALKTLADEAQAENTKAVNNTVSNFILILVLICVTLFAVIALLSRRLSAAIAIPVEREKEMLLQVNRLKTEVLGNVSHELKTPLTVVSGYAQTAAEQIKSGDRDSGVLLDKMKIISSEAERLALMVGQILDVTRIEENRMILEKKPCNMDEIIYAAVSTYYPILNKNMNRLEIHIEYDLPKINADAAKIAQVIVNLISNAIRFTVNGSISISAHKDGNRVEVSVSDTGSGMNEESLTRAFERYTTSSDNAGGTGTGLGLFICKHIIDEHGGEISITSKPGKGTTVVFAVPVV